MVRSDLFVFVALSTAIGLTACASGPSGPVHGGGGDEARGVPNLFISPAGQPYRAGPDQPYPMAQWFAAADADHDGKLTRAEFRADAAAFFKMLDTNHDGVIDGFELQHYETETAPEINPLVNGLRFGEGMDMNLASGGPSTIHQSGGSGQERAGDERPEGAGLFGLINEPEPVAATDAKVDSHITLDEFLAAADRRFSFLDKKSLGYLTLETLPKTPVQRVLERIAARRAKRDAAR